MIASISNNLAALKNLCIRYGVVRLEVFGSAAGSDFDPQRSDVDFLVEFAPNRDLGPWLRDYFALREELEALMGRPIDLVMTGALANPHFIRAVNRTRRLLYAV